MLCVSHSNKDSSEMAKRDQATAKDDNGHSTMTQLRVGPKCTVKMLLMYNFQQKLFLTRLYM